MPEGARGRYDGNISCVEFSLPGPPPVVPVVFLRVAGMRHCVVAQAVAERFQHRLGTGRHACCGGVLNLRACARVHSGAD